MKEYLELLMEVRNFGMERTDRTGVGTVSLFGKAIETDITTGFPLVTTREIKWKTVVSELLWCLKGKTNTAFLRERNVHIWDAWADERGEVGPVYGAQWRSWLGNNGVYDQLAEAIRLLKEDPTSRRILVSAWNVGQLSEMSLPPCPLLFQFYTVGDHFLDIQVYQRSADLFIGVPHDLAVYALLLTTVADVVKRIPRRVRFAFGDVHIYKNHFEQVAEQLSRKPFLPPWVKLARKLRDIDDVVDEDFRLEDYQFHPAIHAPVAR